MPKGYTYHDRLPGKIELHYEPNPHFKGAVMPYLTCCGKRMYVEESSRMCLKCDCSVLIGLTDDGRDNIRWNDHDICAKHR